MADYEFSRENLNEGVGISAFGGHLLMLSDDTENGLRTAELFEGNQEIGEILMSLGIEDAEQFLAIAAIPKVRKELQTTLGMKKKDFSNLLQQVEAMIPESRFAEADVPDLQEFKGGVLPPTPKIKRAAERSAAVADASERVFDRAALPVSVNLIPFMPPIRNQGSRETCVAFVLTAINEYVLLRRNITVDLSEQHLYFEIKQTDSAVARCGTWLNKGAATLHSRGQCVDPIWRYNPNPPCNNHGNLPSQARSNGMNHRLSTFPIPARDVNTYKMHLALQRPVAVALPIYRSWKESETRNSGRVIMRIGGEPAVDNHAVCLVGYQDTPTSPGGGFFILRNSWGTIWGSDSPFGAGYGTIPYQYIANDASEAFTAALAGI